MKRPLVCFTLIFCLGLAFAGPIRINFILTYFLSLIFLISGFLSLRHRHIFDFFILSLALLLGILSFKNSQILPRCHVSNWAYYRNNDLYTIKGFIASSPIMKNNRLSFIFTTKKIQSDNLKYNCCGNILVYLKGRKDLSYGEALALRGKLYRPFGFANNKQPSYRDYLYNQGIYSVMRVYAESASIRLNKNEGFPLKRFALWLKRKLENSIFQHVQTLPASILAAMILGEKRNIPELVYNSMINSGTVHILVVSGFNVGIVTLIIMLILRLIRLPKPLRIYVAIPLLILYCLVTGASNPVIRATIMSMVFMFAYFFKREPDIYNSSCVAILFILGLNSRQLFDIGFQLSFASVISIAYLYPRLKAFLRIESIKAKYLRIIFEGSLVSFSAWLGTMGLIAYYFRIFSPVTVLANMFIVPLASLITLCGFSLIVMTFVCPYLVPFFVHTSEFIVALLLNINALLIKLPGAYFLLS